jgi:acyl carrier protein
MKSVPARVRATLAQHLDCDPGRIHAWQHLEVDLDLTPLELILIALEIEDAEGIDLPVDALDAVTTVGDFQAFVSFAVARHREADRALPQPRPRHRQGATSP